MKNVVALVLAGGQMGDYGVLTQNRAKGALTFAGNYRIIDFAMSNLVSSGINQIGLIIQYLPGSLLEHVGMGHPWDLDNYGKHLKIMPPFVGLAHTAWYKGTADAIYQNLNFVRDFKAEHVIILSGEHVFHMDFKPLVEAHIARDADITVVTREVKPDQYCKRFGYVELEEDGRIIAYHEKPAHPPTDIAATGIYIFKSSTLIERMNKNVAEEEHSLPKDVLQRYVGDLKTYEFRHQGCWEYMENARDYYKAHYKLCGKGTFDEMRSWGILTNLKFRNVGHAPAAQVCRDAVVSNSLISPKCRIEGKVINSILSPGVYVGPGAVVANSILMHDCRVEAGATVEHVIADRDITIGSRAVIGAMEALSQPETSPDDDQYPLTLLGKGCTIGEDIVIPPGAQVRPGKLLSSQEATNLEI